MLKIYITEKKIVSGNYLKQYYYVKLSKIIDMLVLYDTTV